MEKSATTSTISAAVDGTTLHIRAKPNLAWESWDYLRPRRDGTSLHIRATPNLGWDYLRAKPNQGWDLSSLQNETVPVSPHSRVSQSEPAASLVGQASNTTIARTIPNFVSTTEKSKQVLLGINRIHRCLFYPVGVGGCWLPTIVEGRFRLYRSCFLEPMCYRSLILQHVSRSTGLTSFRTTPNSTFAVIHLISYKILKII